MKLLKTLLLSLSLIFSTITFAQTFNAEQQKAIEKIVHDYLIANPQVLMEAATALQKKQQNQWQQTANQVVPAHVSQFFASAMSPVVGNPHGDVTLIEFFDYQCPHCKELSPAIQDILHHDPQLKVIYKPWPIFGEVSTFAAKASLAAMKQGKFLVFHEALMQMSTQLTEPLILKTAEKVGLDVNQLQKDMKNPAFDQEIKSNNQLAKELKLTGTPGFVLANTSGMSIKNPLLIPGAVSENILIEAIGDVRGTRRS